jgi:hypothetical protein
MCILNERELEEKWLEAIVDCENKKHIDDMQKKYLTGLAKFKEINDGRATTECKGEYCLILDSRADLYTNRKRLRKIIKGYLRVYGFNKVFGTLKQQPNSILAVLN